MGDIIYSLPTIMAYGGNAVLYLKFNHLKFFYELLKQQPYICEIKDKTTIESPFINLDKYRPVSRIKKSQHLVLSHLESQQQENSNWINNPWLFFIEPKYVADIIINRTKRYHDKQEIDWNLLKPYENKCKFIGYEKEWKQFVQEYNLDIPFFPIANGLELAQIIKGSKLFIGNQSCSFSLAEAMKHPRCLEVYYELNNCQPHGPNGYTYLTDELILEKINAS